ncbi:MAG: hypothetical protein KF760_33915 [Candidatus Eremiobacteraeota bacterium]|nr:hypothetical protein [Candidatus Eremiobacteraeota bacterium]MCW5872946.1 hypothetical protein [Candidatus Eremiobacteraeota bacterium]
MKPRGATVLELLIAMTIMLVVSALLALLLQSTSRAALRTTMRTEMQQQALVAVQRLLTDLRRSCCAGVSIRSGASPLAIAICPMGQEGVLNNGSLLWSDFYQIYSYDAGARTLNYREWPPGSPTATADELDVTKPRRLSSGRLAEVLNHPPARQLTLMTGVAAFEITYPPGGSDLLLVQPVSVKVVLQRRGNTGHSQPETFTYRRTFFLPEQR